MIFISKFSSYEKIYKCHNSFHTTSKIFCDCNRTSITTPSVSQVVNSSGTYYFRSYDTTCGWGTEGSVTVNVGTAPSAVTISGDGTFYNNTTITASGGAGGTLYYQGTTAELQRQRHPQVKR